MRTLTKTKLLPLLTLALIASAFLFAGTQTVYAIEPTEDQTLSVDDVWLTGDMLNIAVTDSISGESQNLELMLSDYAQPGDEYVTIQATDSNGRLSNTIQIKNPHYSQSADAPTSDYIDPALGFDEPVTCDGPNPFTPDGSGTVIDNASDGDGKEFFNVKTPDGNVFYLIIDRQRSQDNVYLLNEVTEQDLLSLTKTGDGSSPAAPTTTSTTPEPEPQAPEEPVKTVPPTENGGGNSSIILIVIAVIAVGGAGYYFKIVRPKRNGGMDDDDYDEEPEEFSDDTEVDMENDDEEDDYE